MSEEMSLRLSDVDGAPELEFTWSIAHVTEGPEGRYLGYDSTGQPRLILNGPELAKLSERGSV